MRAYFHGFSQIFLAQNALSGLLVVCAMALSSWQLAALAMLGSTVQLAVAGIVPGLIILAALCVASVQVGGFASLGSALGLALAWAVHADVETVSTGMFNYSAVLTAIAVGTVLWPRASWAARLAGAAAGVVLTLCIQWAMSGLPVPTYTWPFVITAWIFALLPTPAEAKRG